MSIVCYYSLKGNSRFLAEKLSERLTAPLFPLIDLKKRHGLFGFFRNEWDALNKNDTDIRHEEIPYNLVTKLILIGPVWMKGLSPAIRTFLKEIPENIEVSLITTASNDKGIKYAKEAARYHAKTNLIAAFQRSGLYKDDLMQEINKIIKEHQI